MLKLEQLSVVKVCRRLKLDTFSSASIVVPTGNKAKFQNDLLNEGKSEVSANGLLL